MSAQGGVWVHTTSRLDPASFAGGNGCSEAAYDLAGIFDLVRKAREGLVVNKAACGAHIASLLIDGGAGNGGGAVRHLCVVSGSIVSEEKAKRRHPLLFLMSFATERGLEVVGGS